MRALAPVVVVLALLLSACGGSPAGEGGTAVALQFPPRAGYAFDADDGGLLTKLGVAEPLVALDPRGNPVPGLATSWAQDGTTWRFALREGVRFHDGAALDANAVVTALTYVLGRPAPPRAITDIGLQVAADGPMTVRATTTAPDPVLPLRLSSGSTSILSPAAYRGGGQPSPVNTATGPLRMTEARGTEGATLERFDGYWGERARSARVDVRYVGDPQTRELALRSGDVGYTEGLPETSRAGLRADPSVTFSEFPSARTILLQLNQSAAPFADVRVRRAVTAALDRNVLAQALGGAAAPASDLFGPAVPYGSTQAPPPADVPAARALLAEAGHGPQNPLRVRLWTFPNRPELPVLAQAIAAQLQAAGITTDITVGEYDAQEPEVLAGRYDMFLNSRSYLSDYPDAASTLTSDYTSGGAYAIDRYRSPAFDALMAQLGAVTDTDARARIYRQAAAMLVTDAVGVPIVHPRNTAVEKGVTGFVADPLDLRPVLPALAPAG
ncbi:ABC transporter substrate-binding protein [Actinomycetospora soli]|uniref:ABC transporter substrate-binding protein n=1 Tax=Actinomycetospora soli TaxID=2893887 RepID=UPI001E4CD588|nr:ABC transporter substrate-binding protein [Actinomycetospora soli]MCD2189831.1 ABC transporter substrate-binding protein [Actinomycetospora soli]